MSYKLIFGERDCTISDCCSLFYPKVLTSENTEKLKIVKYATIKPYIMYMYIYFKLL